MRTFLILAGLPFAAVAAAQTPGPGTAVERVTMHPGQTASFTLAPGKDHQLLNAADPGAKGAITIQYQAAGQGAVIVATSRTGYATHFTILADPDGDGGFEHVGDLDLPGNGTTVARRWSTALGTINVGDFVGGPHGAEVHKPSGD